MTSMTNNQRRSERGNALFLILIAVAEMVGAKSGLGFLVWSAWETFSVEQLYVGLALFALIGFGLLYLGVPPGTEEIARSFVFLLVALAYCGVWLALVVLIGVFESSTSEHDLVLSDVVAPRVRREVIVGGGEVWA